MLRLLIAMMLVSCAAPAGVIATQTPERSATTSSAAPTRSPSATITPTPDPAGLPKCSASQLRAVAAGTMAADLFVGAVFFANRGSGHARCAATRSLSYSRRMGPASTSAWPSSAPPLRCGSSFRSPSFQPSAAGLAGFGATAPLEWSNYCDDVLATSFRITLPDAAGALEGAFVDLGGRPIGAYGTARCDDASGPSTLTIFPFQEPVR